MAGLRRCGLMLIGAGIAAALLSGCETEQDPRSGAFIDGVTNLYTGGYRDYVNERQDDLQKTQDRANTLEARARSITAEREELERELQQASDELAGLQKRLADLQENLGAKRQLSTVQRKKLDEADRRAKDGVLKPVFYKGEIVGSIPQYSDNLLMFRLKALRPDKYRERFIQLQPPTPFSNADPKPQIGDGLLSASVLRQIKQDVYGIYDDTDVD